MADDEKPNFAITGSGFVEDADRDVRVRLCGGDVSGGDFRNARGGRANFEIRYTRGDLYLETVCYLATSVLTYEHQGAQIGRSYEKAYALPVDLLKRQFAEKFERVYGAAPSDAVTAVFIRDIDTALKCMSQPMASAMREHFHRELDLQIIHFEAFGGDPIVVPVDWGRVGDSAMAALASIEV